MCCAIDKTFQLVMQNENSSFHQLHICLCRVGALSVFYRIDETVFDLFRSSKEIRSYEINHGTVLHQMVLKWCASQDDSTSSADTLEYLR